MTNECANAKRQLAKKLNGFGFDCITPDKIISPAPAACRFLQQQALRPHLHIADNLLEDFQPVLDRVKASEANEPANCLVVGDAMEKISRDYVDESMELMLNCPERVSLVSLGAGRYYKDAGRLRMDTGAYVAAFEYALGVKATHFGKPTEEFFREALDAVGGGLVEETVMIGDDVVSDVGGAQKLGMRGFLVRTGKYKRSDETERGVRPDHVFDNLLHAVNTIIDFN